MHTARTTMAVVLGALAMAVATPATAYAASSVTYTDAVGDAVLTSSSTGNSPEADIIRWTVADDGEHVTLTVVVDKVVEVVPPRQLVTVWIPLTGGTAGQAAVRLERTSDGVRVTSDTGCSGTGAVDVRARTYTLRTTRMRTRTLSCIVDTSELRPVVEHIPELALHASPYHDVGVPTAPKGAGYRMVTAAGEVHAFGNLALLQHGSAPSGPPTVDIEATASNLGYLLLASDGTVSASGDARALGNAPMASFFGERAAAISLTPSGTGYWVFSNFGRVIPFGDAQSRGFGDLFGVTLNGPVLDAVATPSGNGYYMVASDGGVFAFGDARFLGSMGATRLNVPVQSLVPDPDGTGYWLVASDGGVFSFEAQFRGSMGSTRLNRPVSGMVAFGNGYLMVGEDGGIFNFSDLPFYGSLGDNPPASPVVSVDA